MNLKLSLAAVVLVAFTSLTAYAIYEVGYLGFFELATANVATITLTCDLVIALGMILIWLVNDARRRGVSAVPYLLITLLLGSVGPLLYVIRTRGDAEQHSVPAEAR
jgi:hypothetical protein